MAKHQFGIMETAPKRNERYDSFEPDRYHCIPIDDDIIEPLMDRFSEVDCFWHSLSVPQKNLAYYGITLIPPSSLKKLIEILEDVPGTEDLIGLLSKAEEEDKYVIHYGI